MQTSSLEIALQKEPIQLPSLLQDISRVAFIEHPLQDFLDSRIQSFFPYQTRLPLLRAEIRDSQSFSPLKVGVVFSGGQASGGHNVIVGLYDALHKMHPDSILYGFLDGPSGILQGKYRKLSQEELSTVYNTGGFDLLGSGRTKIETQEQMEAALGVVSSLQLDGLVIIGGDDSNTNAALLYEYFQGKGCSTKVVGVPKTIDGDLKNEYVAVSFGFDSACKVYSELIGNIAKDALSAKKYYHFIKLMGRSASHVTLECALSVHPNYTLIGEEVAKENKTLSAIIQDLADLVCERAQKGKLYGIVLVPEGLIEFIPEVKQLIGELNRLLVEHPEDPLPYLSSGSKACFHSLPKSIQEQLLFVRDPHGNVQVSWIETEKLLVEGVRQELQRRSQALAWNVVSHFFGYEGRSGFPSRFDSAYCYVLGMTAALLLREKAGGYMCFVEGVHKPLNEWRIGGVPLTRLMALEMRKGKEKPVVKKALVDLESPSFCFFKAAREGWKWKDDYCFPGPIQFWGNKNVCDPIPITVSMDLK